MLSAQGMCLTWRLVKNLVCSAAKEQADGADGSLGPQGGSYHG